MFKALYELLMLVIALAMLALAYLTYEETKPDAVEAGLVFESQEGREGSD